MDYRILVMAINEKESTRNVVDKQSLKDFYSDYINGVLLKQQAKHVKTVYMKSDDLLGVYSKYKRTIMIENPKIKHVKTEKLIDIMEYKLFKIRDKVYFISESLNLTLRFDKSLIGL